MQFGVPASVLAPSPCTTSNPHCRHPRPSSTPHQVGMQSSALAMVLARVHFPHDPAIVAPCVLSACTHATVGSLLAGYWNWQSAQQEAAAKGGTA
jgi:hypothetical protein